ncbi:MAG TPA: hypothetical protein PLA43_09380 [Bryobacteraceae bacterium]|nr:hypothetical protein [Bryobacteraceae bacterium]HOL71785.1 hypothetical protein [Bryobacteraceae bacterium]HOQ44832.1 hypothetical protein [Bryobacteraceae bacterium]HPQ16695.1 hypothetical protein [Bryobacteraceae bacterium]HPU72157.1 hypothetical protein [Bryobacteraceae bacterium]
MFARKLKLTLRSQDGEKPAPKAWLDQFFMRNFTGYSAFDDTLPVADGILEAGTAVDPGEVKAQFEKWLRGRKAIGPETELVVE